MGSIITAIFDLSLAENHTLRDTKEPMKLFLGHTMLFVGSIRKNKSGGFLFVISLWLLVAKETVLSAEIWDSSSLIFDPSLAKNNTPS
jgi:hypothetical protein